MDRGGGCLLEWGFVPVCILEVFDDWMDAFFRMWNWRCMHLRTSLLPAPWDVFFISLQIFRS